MDINEIEFYNNLLIDDEDKPRAALALKSKGVVKHIIIKDKLSHWCIGGKVEYSQVASTYRYDKRLRKILFKYISYLEEFYRAVILDNYYRRTNVRFWIDDLKRNLVKFDNNLNDALEYLDFSSLLIQSERLPKAIRKLCAFPSNKFLKENSIALKELRNAVMHNKFLLFYRGFEVCYVDGVDDSKSASLKANIINLIDFLPNEVGNKCRIEINACKVDTNSVDKTRWNLPDPIIITI